ncbi:hypothetical protein [Microbacterium sp. KR10-403]|uniref:hypothetical protein n=1 Tax=Microbacterium sp. KR10-403 TaxID=3158581 RepID=UPI0032E4F369
MHDDAEPRGRSTRARSVVSAIALVLAVILVPVAVLGTWVRVQLVDTDSFVATFAPLADDPAVQAFVEERTIAAIDEKLDAAGTVDALFDGLEQLDLAPAARRALRLLRAPAVQGVESLISSTVHGVVTSDGFADVWEQVLRQAHSRAVAIIQGQPGTVLQLSDDGTLSIDIGVVVAEVKQTLQAQGVGIADLIPQVTRTVPITTSDSLTLVRTVYGAAVAAGDWLPWLVLGLIAAGIAVAHRRVRALARTAFAAAVVLALLAVAVAVGRPLFVASVSPSPMPAETADAVYGQLTEAVSSTTAALLLLAAVTAVAAWLAGSSRSATGVRSMADDVFAAVRRFADAHGAGTGRFGHVLDRWRGLVVALAAVLCALAVFLQRPVAAASVVTALVCFVVVVLLVELLRRTDDGDAAATETVDGDAADQPPISVSIGPRAK